MLQDGFLHRYVKQYGVSAHHMTFRVDNLYKMREKCEAMGYEVVGFDDKSDPDWWQFFIHPKNALGLFFRRISGVLLISNYCF
jgi:hypothetical protein